MKTRWSLLGALLPLMFAVAACTAAAPAASSTATTGASAAPPSAQPSALVSPATTPVASPEPSMVNPIADGIYRTGTIQVSAIIARIDADATLTKDQKAGYISGFTGHKTEAFSIEFGAGAFTEADSLDGSPFQTGATATFAFPDRQTLVIQEDCCGLSTFVVTVQAHGFALKYKAGAPNAGEDIIGQAIYETSPFTLVP